MPQHLIPHVRLSNTSFITTFQKSKIIINKKIHFLKHKNNDEEFSPSAVVLHNNGYWCNCLA